MSETTNDLKKVKIGGKYVGGNDLSKNLVLPENIHRTSLLFDQSIVEKFSLNACKYIADIAEEIVELNNDFIRPDDFGLYDESLPKKFENMKCTDSYKIEFDSATKFFPQIHRILHSDSIKNGHITLIALFSIIKKLYSIILDKYDDGPQIHASLLGLLTADNIDPVYCLALDVVIFYTVYSCGIFNERK